MSVGYAPRRPAGELVPALVMLPALAVVDCIERLGNGRVEPKIKWVNDIVLDGRKVAGVLTATSTIGPDIDSAVVGVGINVSLAPSITPTPFVPAVGCLADVLDPAPSLARVLGVLLDRLAARYEDLLDGGATRCWRSYCRASAVVGESVRIYDESYRDWPSEGPAPEPIARGIVERIDESLALWLRGQREPVTRGRLAFERVFRPL